LDVSVVSVVIEEKSQELTKTEVDEVLKRIPKA